MPQDKEEKTKKAIERLSNPEEIDQMLSIAQPSRKKLVYTVTVLLAVLLLWAFFGRIPLEVQGRGVALSPKGVFAILARAAGSVEEIYVKEGNVVTPKTRIMSIDDPQRMAILRNIESTQHRIEQLQGELLTLEARLETRRGLYKEGLVAKTVVEDTQITVVEKRIQIEDARGKLASLYSDLEKTSSLGRLPQISLFDKYQMNSADIDRFLSMVYSPSDGRVLEVLVNKGEVVQVEDPLVWLEYPHSEDEPVQFICCIPVQDRERIRVGMKARLEPTTVNPQEFGSIIGEVTEVSSYVVSEEELLNTLYNKQLVNFLTDGGKPVIRLIVKPERDSDTFSGLRWTSGDGPPFKIPAGTICHAKIVVEEQPPISFLFPLWKLKPY